MHIGIYFQGVLSDCLSDESVHIKTGIDLLRGVKQAHNKNIKYIYKNCSYKYNLCQL